MDGIGRSAAPFLFGRMTGRATQARGESLSQASVLDSFIGSPLASGWLTKQSPILAARIVHAFGSDGPWRVIVRSDLGSVSAVVDDKTGDVSSP